MSELSIGDNHAEHEASQSTSGASGAYRGYGRCEGSSASDADDDIDVEGTDEVIDHNEKQRPRADGYVDIENSSTGRWDSAKALFDTGADCNVISEVKRRECGAKGLKAPTALRTTLGNSRTIEVDRYCELK